MAGVNPEIPGAPSQSQLMAAAAAMQGASMQGALSYLGMGNPSIPGGKNKKNCSYSN